MRSVGDIIGISGKSLPLGLKRAIPAGQSTGPTIAIDPSTNKIYVANPTSGVVSVIDGTTDTVAKIIKIPVLAPISITVSVNPSTNKIYVATHPAGVGGGMMFVIAGSTDTIAKSFPIPYCR
jgi:YVTN family beta-propeller protein